MMEVECLRFKDRSTTRFTPVLQPVQPLIHVKIKISLVLLLLHLNVHQCRCSCSTMTTSAMRPDQSHLTALNALLFFPCYCHFSLVKQDIFYIQNSLRN